MSPILFIFTLIIVGILLWQLNTCFTVGRILGSVLNISVVIAFALWFIIGMGATSGALAWR